MIGVAVHQADLPWVAEFFELFKTPWEPVVPGTHYRVVLSADGRGETFGAGLALVYGAKALQMDERFGITVHSANGPSTLTGCNETLSVYGATARFSGGAEDAVLKDGVETVGYRKMCGGTTICRLGYDLFSEVSHLLTTGQPKEKASSPTLELHIALIRAQLEDAGIPYVEVPSRPNDVALICCLTHDVDFFALRRHRGDSTLAGFALRATAGTFIEVLRGRRRIDEAMRNFASILRLPFVFLGLARDFWQPFEDYARVEGRRPSTFFLIPFKGRTGVSPDGQRRRWRAAPYGARDIQEQIATHQNRANVEFAVHGIDAWRDAASGKAELQEVSAATGNDMPGVRMHWLYFSDESPRALEEAGFAYDSTYGFNDAIGYRAGTAQAFRLPGCDQLMELPMAIMDTALFYLDRMGLNRRQALERCAEVVSDVRRFGGALVVNWHDRSLAPERQWERPYRSLLAEIEKEKVWYATAREAVDWFRWRRAIRFTIDKTSQRVQVTAPPPAAGLPPASLRVRRTKHQTEEARFAGTTQTLTL
jgi:hypothetical protein